VRQNDNIRNQIKNITVIDIFGIKMFGIKKSVLSTSSEFDLRYRILLKEPSGTLGSRVQETMFTANNIFIIASKSGKLTSNHFEIWIKELFFSNVGPNSVLLLDSWTGHCPDIIERNRPESAHDFVLLTIPTGTTGRIQSLDVFLVFIYGKILLNIFRTSSCF